MKTSDNSNYSFPKVDFVEFQPETGFAGSDFNSEHQGFELLDLETE